MRSLVPARLLLLALVILVAACGPDDTTNGAAPTTTASGTTATSSQACADADALRASIAELVQLNPSQVDKAGIQAAVDKVRTDLATLKASAKTQWSSQIAELDAAMEALGTTIAGIDDDNLRSAVPAIVGDLSRIGTAWTALQQQIDRDCG